MGVAGWLSSALALNGVTWTVSSQSKSNVSLNPSEVLRLFPCDRVAVLTRVADRSRLLERALGLGFSHGFFNGARSALRPLSGLRTAGSGLMRGCCWACFLLGRCCFLIGAGSGVECWNSSMSTVSAKSGSAPCEGLSWLPSSLRIGLAIKAPKPATGSPSLNDPASRTRSDLLRLLLSAWRRLTPTVDGKVTCLLPSDRAFFSDGWGSVKKKTKSIFLLQQPSF